MTETASPRNQPAAFPKEARVALIEQFEDAFIRQQPDDQLYARIFDRPALLWPERWPDLEAYAAAQDPGLREALMAAIEMLKQIEGDLAGQGGWYEGGGPIQHLAKQVADGLMVECEAAAAVAAPDINWRLSSDYIRRMSRRAAYLAREDWEFAVPFSRLILAAADAYPVSPARDAMRREAILGWIETATRACGDVPDGAIFNDAKTRGLELLAEQERAADDEGAALTLFTLGVLHLDPYQAGRNFNNIATELKWWLQRFVDRYGEAALADESRRMPPAMEAGTEAAALLRRAADLQSGVARGLSLKARSDALLLIEFLGGPADHEDLRATVEEALSLLPPADYPSQNAALINRLQYLGEPAEASVGGDLDQADPAALIAELGYTAAFDRYKSTITVWLQEAPDRAIAATLRLFPHLRESEKVALGHSLFTAILRTSNVDALLARSNGDYEAAADATSSLPEQDRLRELAALAAHSTGASREAEGLAAAERAVELSRKVAPEMTEALQLLLAWVLIGAGVNGATAGRWDGTTQFYCDALAILTDIAAFESVSNLLGQTADAAVQEGDDGIIALSMILASVGPRLSRADVPRLGDQVHQVWIKLFARMFETGNINPALFNIQVQAAKGAAFAVMLRSGSVYEAARDAAAMDLLDRRAATGATEGLSDVMLNEFVLISHHVEPTAQTGPVGAVERLAQRFDGHVGARMTDGKNALEAYLLDDEWSQRLDPADLLVDQFLCSDNEGGSAIITGVHSVEGRKLTAGRGGLPLKYLQMDIKDHPVEANVFGLLIADLRQALQEHPGPALANDKAVEGLASVASTLQGAFPIFGEEAGRARDHLCFVPHGPYHFCPFHLLPDGDGILADRWTVSSLPHPALLRRRHRPLDPERTGLAAFGLSFAGEEHGLAPLPCAADEARAVASLMGGQAWTDADATEARLVESLSTCRYVHLATHGRQNVFAPTLQQLYLAPAEGSDGIFHAYEALGLDLGHMDMVTLSACETALGRFDINDNLRGLAATLIIAGVPTVISTLWPVRDSVARLFFESLYGHLAAGGSKLTAFRAAQLETREAHPAYRDWGAFVFAGCW